MKRRLSTLLAVAAVAGVMTMFSPATPAQAVPQEVCAGLGSTHLTSPFVYPVVGQAQPPGTPPAEATLHPNSAGFLFHFDTGACVPSLTAVSAFGSVHGWCGLSSGSGVTSAGDRFAAITIGSILLWSGGVSGILNELPNLLAGESCITGADNFLINGGGVRNSCDIFKNKTTASVNFPATSTSVAGLLHISSGGHLPINKKFCL